ncbi:MAG: signal peptidase I [Eubacterium sp.]|nr:signal peptidase I [Eubacterium sp.]
MENGEFNEEERPSEVRKPSRLKYVIEGLIYIALIVVCVYVVPKYVIQRTVVSGESMEDTLHDAESLLIDKISYRFTDPKRYDIIVFYPKGRDVDEYYVKRIYGLPGETIQIKGNDIFINGEKIDDPYAKDSMSTGGIANEPYTLGKDEYFVLGDHRSVSQDSRFTPETSNDKNVPGPVKFENISGKVILRIWPLSKFGVP